MYDLRGNDEITHRMQLRAEKLTEGKFVMREVRDVAASKIQTWLRCVGGWASRYMYSTARLRLGGFTCVPAFLWNVNPVGPPNLPRPYPDYQHWY